MACSVTLSFKDGRSFLLGRYNEGKKTSEQIAITAARKYKALVGKLGCGDATLVIAHKNGPREIPVHAIQEDI